MNKISIDNSKALSFLPAGAMEGMQTAVEAAHETLMSGSGKGCDFLGWLRLPSSTENRFLSEIQESAMELSRIAEVLVVVGIGGSYLGARAVIEALQHPFCQLQKKKDHPVILYAGNNLSEDYHAQLLEVLSERSWAMVVISKSGTTTEPAVAFRLLKEQLEKQYGREEAGKRIVAITDAFHGALRQMAEKEGYLTFIIPDDVGGRFSVLTPVGLFPIAFAGFDIHDLLDGARDMQEICLRTPDFTKNPAAVYAATRNLLYQAGRKTEIMVTWQPHLVFLSEWWKQLFGESEGKEGKGIFPASVSFTTDLHSLGQYIQEGTPNHFETVLNVERPERVLQIPPDPVDGDGLNYIAGRRLSEVNRNAQLGTLLAHVEGGVPNIRINIPAVNEFHLGQLIYFYEYACAVSGYVLGVNPFDQPGVEAYKRNMFALLGKPGYEQQGKKLRGELPEQKG